MTVRTSMASLITTLRGFANAGLADYSIDSTAYFSNEQLQAVLDRYKTDLNDIQIIPRPTMTAGAIVQYKEYQSPAHWLETTDTGGSARFIVSDGLGSVLDTSLWSADYENGLVTFTNDQAGSARYLTAHSYDVYAAAADVWQQKAAAYATMIDFTTDNHSIKRSHIVAQCESMAKRYAGMAVSGGGASSVDAVRGDTRAHHWRHDYD